MSGKVKLRRIVSILLVFILLMVSASFVFAGALQYENSGIEFLDSSSAATALYNQTKDTLPKTPQGGIPPQWITIQNTILYINYRLWQDKEILVYGNYSKVPGNNFKRGTQPSQGVHLTGVNDGYYKNPYGDPNRGEWRYHGYDVSGNKFSNINFIDDGSGTSFNERNWVKKPWLNLPKDKQPVKSIYNEASMGDHGEDAFTQSHVQDWIDKSLDIYQGVPLQGDKLDPEVFQYMNVLSAPTPVRLGQGRMWHMMENGSIWYQTLTVPTVHKENLPVEAVVTPLTPLNIEDIGAEMDNHKVTLQFKVTATLNDTAEYSDAVKKSVYYTREDIAGWKLTFTYPTSSSTSTLTKTDVSKVGNTGSYTFSISTTYDYLRSKNWRLHLNATGQPLYVDNTRGYSDNASYDYAIGVTTPTPPLQSVVFPGFTPQNNISENAFDGVPFTASDSTDMSMVASRKVYIDGQQVDDSQFFSGSYIFNIGDVGVNGKFIYVDVVYELKDYILPEGIINTRDIVYIYPTKPIANFSITSNTWRQNRLIDIQNTSNAGNIQLVVQNYPIVQYRWTFGGDTSQLVKGTDTDLIKQLLYKQPGVYSVTLECCNTLGKWSDPYTVSFEVLEDIPPAIGLNLSDSVIWRNDSMESWYYNVCSTDGDVIKSVSIELWYDSDNNGMVDTKLKTWDGTGQFPSYMPTKLGYYKYIVKAQEDITGDTLPQFITDTDKKSSTYEVEWWVDNYQPMADLYVNIPIQRPNIDVFFMLDKNLDQTKREYMLSNRMNIANWLIGKNIIPNISMWDMKTYTYSQPASTSSHTGSSYPSSSVSYASNGYSGTLNLSSISNNSYSRDEGHTETRTETKTATAGGQSVSGHGASSTYPPSSVSYSDGDGFSGTLSAYGYSYSSWACGHSKTNVGPNGCTGGSYYWTRSYAGYSGTVSRTASYWVPKIVWYNDYTGYYSGTIYKDVRQPYVDPFNPTSLKYVVYISDNTISELSDLNMVKSYTKDAKLIIAGTSAIKSQTAYDKYFDVTGNSIDAVANDVLQSISDNSPAVEKYYVLQNQSFQFNIGSLDLENDPIIESGMQYVQDQDYFDNPTGSEPGTISSFSDSSGWTANVKSSFANVGEYSIYRRVKDRPSTDPIFAPYSYYSTPALVEVYVVRKPVALANLDWDYIPSQNVYKTTWVDKSYSPDHQYSRPDKGIVDRNIMWRQTGGQWNYGIPDNLAPGTYELNYYVKSPEGFWSDPFVINFTLSPTPAMQFVASLRALDSSFSLSSIPASEYLKTYDIWTRYPYNVNLQMALYKGTTLVSSLKTVNYGTSVGSKDGNDIHWNNVPYQIPDTLSDGTYTFRITAAGDYGQSASKDFAVMLNTPINLVGKINGITSNAEVEADSYNSFIFNTSKYVSKVQLGFKGQTYKSDSGAISLISSDGTDKVWEAKVYVPSSNVTDGETGYATFTAFAPSAKSELVNVNYKTIAIQAYDFTITSILDVSWRGYYFDLQHPINGDGEKYGYPKRSGTDIKTSQMPINSLSLVPYGKQSVKAGYKIMGYIQVKGAPDSAKLKARYFQAGIMRSVDVPLNFSNGDRYDFVWIIPRDTDQRTYVSFDVEMRKSGVIYGNEKWMDTWPVANTSRSIIFVDKKVTDDLEFNQSH